MIHLLYDRNASEPFKFNKRKAGNLKKETGISKEKIVEVILDINTL